MATQPDDIGESTITLATDDGRGERRFWARLGAVLLLGSLLAPFNVKLAARLGGRPRLASSVTLLLTVLLFILPVSRRHATEALRHLKGGY